MSEWRFVCCLLCLALGFGGARSARAQAPPEVNGLSWCSGSSSCLQWNAAAGATGYRVYSGTRATLPGLINVVKESCLAASPASSTTGSVLTTVPDACGLFWYLVDGVNASGEGLPGSATAGPRLLDSTGACAATCAAQGSVCAGDNACCSGRCVSGACADACCGGWSCAPVPACPYGQAYCAGTCVAVANDSGNCGGCGSACALPHAANGCSQGSCYIASCQAGFADVDHAAANGCEYACPVSPPVAETCNGIDDDCDGAVDNGLTPPTGICSTLGVCAGQTIPVYCGGATGWACNYSGVPFVELDPSGHLATLETLCDAMDGNCNGVVDLDGFPTLHQTCTAGLGVCQGTGTVVCKTPTTAGCNAIENPSNAVDELCDGRDNDCDGLVDERADSTGPTGLHHGWRDAMVAVPKPGGGTVWVYAYEASRPGATGASAGSNASRSCSRPGVLPWATLTQAQAAAACAAVVDSAAQPLRLCTAAEWQSACEGTAGPAAAKWSLSNNPAVYAAQICNDVNEAASPCVWAAGSNGAQSGSLNLYCYTDWGSSARLYDMSGNLSEWTSSTMTSNGVTYYQCRGGSFFTPQAGATCESDGRLARAGFAEQDLGFRCCADNAP